MLAGALAFLVLPSYGTAQAPRRPAAPDTPQRAAIRALNEGRFDEVDALADKMDARDPSAAALKARAAIARGRYPAAEALLRPVGVAGAAERSGARARPAAADARPHRRDADSREGGGARRHERRSARSAARRARLARARALPRSERGVPRSGRRPAVRSGGPDRVRRAVPREKRQGRSAEVVPDGAAGRSALDAGAGRRRQSAVGRQSAAGGELRQARARNQSVRRRRVSVCRRRRRRRRPLRRGAQGDREGARR